MFKAQSAGAVIHRQERKRKCIFDRRDVLQGRAWVGRQELGDEIRQNVDERDR